MRMKAARRIPQVEKKGETGRGEQPLPEKEFWYTGSSLNRLFMKYVWRIVVQISLY